MDSFETRKTGPIGGRGRIKGKTKEGSGEEGKPGLLFGRIRIVGGGGGVGMTDNQLGLKSEEVEVCPKAQTKSPAVDSVIDCPVLPVGLSGELGLTVRLAEVRSCQRIWSR